MTTSMKSLQTAVTATKLLLRKNLQPALSTPQRLHHSSCLTSSNVPQKHTPLVSIFALQKRTIMKDSWAAESIEANGEKLESIDHKEGLLIDTEYVEGPPPAEVLRLCNEILKLNLVDVHILMNSVQVSILVHCGSAAVSLLSNMMKILSNFCFLMNPFLVSNGNY